MESHTSSAAVKRTSIGNDTCSPLVANQRCSAPITSGSAARGIANSDSWKRTRRRDTNTSCDGATNSRAERAEPEKRLIRGTSEGRAWATRLSTSNAPLLSSSSSTRPRSRPIGAGAVPSGTRLLRLSRAFSVCGNQ